MKLSEAGYGDIKTIKELDVKTFINLIHYENYKNQYLQIFKELNNNIGKRK